MQWGVLVDFFDEKGIAIDIDADEPERYENGGFDYYVLQKGRMAENEKPLKTRQEARKAALDKAIEIYNGSK